MATSKIKSQGWKFIGSSIGGDNLNYTDLASQGFTEVFVKDSSFGGCTAPVAALPTKLVWGGYYGGVNGLLHGVDVSTTSMYGIYGRTDSSDYLGNQTFYLYAR